MKTRLGRSSNSSRKFISLILSLILLTGCTSTNIYLYRKYLSSDEEAVLIRDLKKAGFTVESNDFSFPDGVQSSRILYSPFLKDASDISKVQNILAAIGWRAPLQQPLVEGNHWYSKNSIGLMIIPPGIDPNDKVLNLTNKFTSSNCLISAELTLKPNGQYYFGYEEDPNEFHEHKSGTWVVTGYPYLKLTSSNKAWDFYYEIVSDKARDLIGQVELITLKPLSTHHIYLNCNLVFGQRA